MQKTKWREQIDRLEVGDSVEVTPTMNEASFRAYIYGNIYKETGKKFSINKLDNNQYNITRNV